MRANGAIDARADCRVEGPGQNIATSGDYGGE